MSEWIMIAVIGSGALLFPAGGTHIDGIGGQKWMRRELLPIIWGVALLLSGIVLWKFVLFVVLQDIIFRLPYGERTPYWLKFIVLCCYTAPQFLIGITFWQFLPPILLLILFALSNNPSTAKDVPWKAWEASAGFLVGVSLAVLISKL